MITIRLIKYKIIILKMFRKLEVFCGKAVKGNYSIAESIFNNIIRNNCRKYYNLKYQSFISNESCYNLRTNDINIGSSYKKSLWLCWLQGFDKLPIEYKLTLDSIVKHCSDYNIIKLSYNNIFNYIDIPKYILTRYNDGNLKPAHFADYIRVSVLEKYGGLWLDVSILMVKGISNNIFNTDYWSPKHLKNYHFDTIIPSPYDWQIYALASVPHGYFISEYKSAIELLFANNDDKIDYFCNYYLAEILRNKSYYSQLLFNRIPSNNISCESLQDYIIYNDNISFKTISKITNSGSSIFKLNIESIKILYNNFDGVELNKLYE